MFKRTLLATIQQVNQTFPVLLLTGPRQVGKTTLLKACAEEGRNYVSLDNLAARQLALADPELFFQTYKVPLIIDEIQYAPNLFVYIKIMADEAQQSGMFWLTGSQKFHLMRGVNESLAGRVAIINMLGLSQAELAGQAQAVQPFLPTKSWCEQANKRGVGSQSLMDIYQHIWEGSFPKLYQNREVSREIFYDSYVQTYIQRDVRDMLNIADELSFRRFISAVAARTGQLLNYSNLARDVGIDHKTAKAWLSVLEASGLVYLLQPYYRNVTKRLLKTPKLYFLDTGLCCHLTQWPSAEALEAGAMSGAILETYIFSEILKSYWHSGRAAYFYFYRDTDQREIDLLLEFGDTLYPVEFKKTASPNLSSAKHFTALNQLGKEIGAGAVLCLAADYMPLSREVAVIPISYL